MAWNSFTDVVDLIVSALKNNADLASFCTTNFKEALIVRKGIKRREEIGVHELPIVMVTVSGQQTSYGAGRLLYREYTVRFFCGFRQEDRTKAPDQVLKFEELIEQAVLTDAALNGDASSSTPGDSAYDEGFFHPVYFQVKEFKVMVERDI